MNKLAVLISAAFVFVACGNSNQPTQTTKNNSNIELVSSHSQTAKTANNEPTATPVTKSETKTKWTQSGNPIDTTAFDTEIKQAEEKLKANPKNEGLKKSLAEAFLKRATALTEARQYASAIGDYRRVSNLDPTNEEAKIWIKQIVEIYSSINRTYPAEGEEPPPLPFKQS